MILSSSANVEDSMPLDASDDNHRSPSQDDLDEDEEVPPGEI